MEQDFKTNRPREAYEAVNLFRKGDNPRASLRKKEGWIIIAKEEVLSRWRAHFEHLLNPDLARYEDQSMNAGFDESDNLEGSPTMVEAVQKLKSNKTPGTDNIPAELIKHGGEALLIKLQLLFDEI